MRWPVFAILAYLFLVLEEGLRTLVAIGYTSPSLLLILAVFVGLWAPSRAAAWAGLALGLLIDLSHPVRLAGQAFDFALIGPACLGYFAAVYVTLQLRGMVFRDSALAIGVLVLIAGLFARLVAIAILTVRGLPWLVAEPLAGWDAADQLVAGFLELLYTAVVAVPIGYLLIRFKWVWGFTPSAGPGYGGHHARR